MNVNKTVEKLLSPQKKHRKNRKDERSNQNIEKHLTFLQYRRNLGLKKKEAHKNIVLL